MVSKPVHLKFGPTGAESGLTDMKETVPMCFSGWWSSKLPTWVGSQIFFISEVQAEDRKQDTKFHAYPQMQAPNFHQLNSRKKSWRFYRLFSKKEEEKIFQIQGEMRNLITD